MAENVEIRDIVFNLQVRTEDGKVKIDGLTKGFVKAETAIKKMQATLNDVNTGLKDTGLSSGLANTAVLEFGRTISDAPYGIQGMGNNITQLVTILGQMQGELKEGETLLGNFRKAMVGPLGVVVAIQVIVAALEFYRKAQSKAIAETNKFNDTLATLNMEAAKLEILGNIVKNNSGTLELQEKALTALKDNGFDPTTQSIEDFIEAQKKLAVARATAEAFSEEIVNLEKERLRLIDEGKEQLSDLLKAQEEGDTYRASIIKAQLDTTRDLIKDIEGQSKGVKDRMERLFENVDLVDFLFGGNKPKDKKERRDKVKKLVLEVYDIASIEAQKKADKQQKLMKKMGIDIHSMLTGGKEGQAELKKGIESLYKEVEPEIDYSGVGTSFNEILETMAPAFAEIGNFFAAEADRAIAIETNKTNRINDELKRRLANEQLSADERDKINQQIAKNEAKLVEKENEINKKRFEQEKAFSIVQATVNTYLAASDVLAREKMGAVGKAIAVAAVITSGLAQVAAISRQKFTAKALPSPNLTGQGTAGAGLGAPDFNVIGASGRSQLAEAIAGTRNEPLKAYVVASDVTSAQELERKIVEGASI